MTRVVYCGSTGGYGIDETTNTFIFHLSDQRLCDEYTLYTVSGSDTEMNIPYYCTTYDCGDFVFSDTKLDTICYHDYNSNKDCELNLKQFDSETS